MSQSDRQGLPPSEQAGNGSVGLPILPPLVAVIEIALLVILPGLLDLFVQGFPQLNETQPHVFWVPVLLVTLQYGSVSGLLAAGSAIVMANLLGWPEQEIGENHFNYLLRIWLQPVLWMAMALILGQLRLRQIERKEALGKAVEELSSQRQALAEHARNLRERCDRLERVLATRSEPDAHALLACLGRIHTAPRDEAPAALRRTLEIAFPASEVGVYLLEGDGLRLALRKPAAIAGDIALPELIGSDHPVFAALLGEGRDLSVLEPGDELALSGLGLAAVPIRGKREAGAAGVLLLASGSALELDENVPARLAGIAAAVASRIEDDRPRHDALSARAEPAAPLPRPAQAWRRVRWQAGRERPQTARGGRAG